VISSDRRSFHRPIFILVARAPPGLISPSDDGGLHFRLAPSRALHAPLISIIGVHFYSRARGEQATVTHLAARRVTAMRGTSAREKFSSGYVRTERTRRACFMERVSCKLDGAATPLSPQRVRDSRNHGVVACLPAPTPRHHLTALVGISYRSIGMLRMQACVVAGAAAAAGTPPLLPSGQSRR